MSGKGLTGRALGEAVIDHVLTYPERHYQGAVVTYCGTQACIAGWVLILGEQRHPFDIRHDWDEVWEPLEAGERAADLLGVPVFEFLQTVYEEFDRDRAISNFKHLLDETYSEPTS